MKLTLALLASLVSAETVEKKCYKPSEIIQDKPIHHASGALAAKLWPSLSNGCGRQNCSEKQCAESCETLDACKAWTFGNGNRCYLMDEQHLKYVGEAPTNGAFNSGTCTESQQESLDVEMSVDYTEEEFKAKKTELTASIAASLGVSAGDIEISIGSKVNPREDARRLSTAALLITVTFKVPASKVSTIVEKLETPTFKKATGASFVALKPAHGSSICATCTWDGTKIHVTHYINAQRAGVKGAQHKCYHDKTSNQCHCKCF